MPPPSTARPGTMSMLEAVQVRMPLAARVSILHRASGGLMFALLPFVIWLFDASISSEVSYDRYTSAFVAGIGVVPGGIVKLVVLALIWAFLHHFLAGVRHLWMDATHSVNKAQGQATAAAVLGGSGLLTLVLGAKLFGLY